VMMLYRDDYYDPESADAGIAEMIVQKNRNGALGTVKAQWSPTYTTFESLARREYVTSGAVDPRRLPC
jgi:replicative DNA helicase